MSYGVAILNKVKSVKVGHIYSLVHNAELQNGMVCHVGDLVEGEKEIRKVVVPTAETVKADPLVLIAHSEVNYDESSKVNSNLENFKIEANEPFRAYELGRDDIVSISTDVVDGTAEKGKYLVADATKTTLKVADTLLGTEAFAAKIEDVYKLGTTTFVGTIPGAFGNVLDMVKLRIIKNA